MDVARLYSSYGQLIRARCRRILKDTSAAEDAAQDVFIKIMLHLDSAPEEQSLLPWMLRIATNHCLNIVRDARRRAEALAFPQEFIDDEFENRLLADNFARHVLTSSPEALKTPAMMYHSRGIPQSKVAAALGVSRRTVLYRLAEFSRRAETLNAIAERTGIPASPSRRVELGVRVTRSTP
jgi:RNA polymerase sigma-70 factor, ECF subfamily